MQPSSLVFLVIIAVWAAYFLQYWVRRREHLATARSVDQFSESMRVLERRSPLPAADLSTPLTPSYAVSPARPARAQILVKRAATTEPAAVASARPSASAPVRTSASASVRPSAPAPAPAPPTGTDRAAARRNRALILLSALSTVIVTVPLVALGMLPLVTLFVPVASIGIAVAWARSTATAERQAGRGAGPVARLARPVSTTQTARPMRSQGRLAREVPAGTVDVLTETATKAESEIDAEINGQADGGADLRQTALYDVQAVERREHEAVRASQTAAAAPATRPVRLVDEDDIPLTWDPVPVPRPTYTMKSRATRPAPAAADLVGDADTEYAAYEEAPVRRVAGA